LRSAKEAWVKYILVASHNKADRDLIRSGLGTEYIVELAVNKNTCLDKFKKKRYEFLFIDILLLLDSSPKKNYSLVLQQFLEVFPAAQIITMSSQEMIRDAVMAVKAGASNYLTYPINPVEVRHVVESIREFLIVNSELTYHRDKVRQNGSPEIISSNSPLMNQVFKKISSVAPTKSTVLLIGETGTGKNLMAKRIHLQSNRRDGPFINVHCGAIPDTLLESEMFGHEKGAFTGAVRRKLGKFEIARGGTIFLDEIGTITPSAQIKLLQILQDGTLQRLGGEEPIETNARVIAATNIDLKESCEQGQFRKDLYYRLNVFPIEIPPLRDRTVDIPVLVDEFLQKMNQKYAKKITGIHPEVMNAFQIYPWHGNIRELENLIERAYILEVSSILCPDSFPQELFPTEKQSPLNMVDTSRNLAATRRYVLEQTEKQYLSEVLSRHTGCIKDSASTAGITTRQLHKLMKKHNLNKETYKSGKPR